MTRQVFLLFLAWILCMPGAAKAQSGIVEFADCRASDVACYQGVSAVRSVQLASERERLFVAVERAQYEDFEQARQHRSYVLWGQYFQGWVLLLIGIAVVVTGMVMSWQQMAKGLRDGVSLDNAFELGRDGLRLRSPVVGLFIFGASLWFFNIYIDKVYAVTILQESSVPAAQESPATGKSGEAGRNEPQAAR